MLIARMVEPLELDAGIVFEQAMGDALGLVERGHRDGLEPRERAAVDNAAALQMFARKRDRELALPRPDSLPIGFEKRLEVELRLVGFLGEGGEAGRWARARSRRKREPRRHPHHASHFHRSLLRRTATQATGSATFLPAPNGCGDAMMPTTLP